jgi:hypothetical protein
MTVDDSDATGTDAPDEHVRVDAGEVSLASSTPEGSSGLAIVLLAGGSALSAFEMKEFWPLKKKVLGFSTTSRVSQLIWPRNIDSLDSVASMRTILAARFSLLSRHAREGLVRILVLHHSERRGLQNASKKATKRFQSNQAHRIIT